MTIRRKVLLSLGASMLGLLIVFLLVGRHLRLGEVLAREENAVREDIKRFASVLHHEFTHFSRMTNADAFWAGAAEILFPKIRPSPSPLESKGEASVFILNDTDILGFVSPGGEVLRARRFDRGTGREIGLPRDFAEQLRPGTPAAKGLAASDSAAWILSFDDTPYLVVSHQSVAIARPHFGEGALIIARKIDPDFLDQMDPLADLPLKLLPVSKTGVPPEIRDFLDSGTGRRSAVYVVSDETIAGIIQAKDPAGRPTMVISFERPRSLFQQFNRSWRTFAQLVAAFGLLMLLLSGVVVEKIAIARLTKLAAFVKTVDTNADIPALVPVEGGDEIAGLAVSINGMLDSLHNYNLERRDLIQRLESDSLEDALTGLYNRRGFLTIGREYLNLSARNKSRMHLLFLDMDNLKQINDTFGHACGDEAIVRSAEIIKSVFRGSDIKSRLGGDEFAVFPIASSPQGLKAAINRFHEKTAEFNRSGVCPFTLAFSLGVSGYDPENPSTIDDLLDRADKRMYEDKRRKSGGTTRT